MNFTLKFTVLLYFFLGAAFFLPDDFFFFPLDFFAAFGFAADLFFLELEPFFFRLAALFSR